MTRGADNTTPVGHSAGFTVRNVVSAAWLQSLDDKVKYATLNVKDYGAQGDNFTNDGPAIQAALDDAWRAGGAQVIIPKGIYRIMSAASSAAPLKVRSNVRLTALPGAEIHRYSNPSGASLVWSGDFSQGLAAYNGQRNMVIEGGTWDMRNSASTSTLAADTFTKATTSAPHALGTTTTGSLTWIDETSRDDGTAGTADTTVGNLGITANAAYNPVASTGIASIVARPDGTTQVTVSTKNTTGQTGLIFRLQDAQNYWQYTCDATNARLSYWVNGVETVVSATSTQAVAAGSTLTVTCFGTRIIAGVITSGTYAMSHDVTDPSGFTALGYRKSGVIITDTTSRLTNFSSSGSIWADNFNRTSAVSLGTTSSGYAWTAQSGTLGTTGGATAYAPGAGTNISTVDVTSECNPTVTVTTVGTTLNGLVFRYIDSSNYWYYARNAAGNAELAKVVAGSTTIITPTASTAVANGNVLNVSVIGYEIACYVGSTQTHSVNNDSANYAGTKAGIIINDTTARLDNFDTPASWGGGLLGSGACFSWSHTSNTVWRDITIRDTHQNSHGIDLQGCTDVLIDNVRFLGAVGNQQRGAVQIDAAYNDGSPPKDSTNCKDVLIRGCTVSQSYSAGTNVYGRGFESHASRVTTWYSGIRIVDNYIDVAERAIRGYNWNNSTISNNQIVSGWGIEYRPIWTGSGPPDVDTMNRTGLQTSASQNIAGITITGNTIDATGSTAGGTDAAIRVFGESTGHVQFATITGNTIKATPSIGISVEFVDMGTVTGNVVTNTGGNGIQIKSCTETNASGNVVYVIGGHGIDINAGSGSVVSGNRIRLTQNAGIYIEAGANRNMITGNYIKGANRVAAGTFAAVSVSGNAGNINNMIMGNRMEKEGDAGNEAAVAIKREGGTAAGIVVINNSFQGWSATHASNFTIGSLAFTTNIDAVATANNCLA